MGGPVSRQAVSRLGHVRFGRDRGKRQRYREIERRRNKETDLTIKIPNRAGWPN